MGIVKRISELLSANLNELIDQCENPEKMLKQAVREMEAALGQLMDAAARAIGHHKLLARQLTEENRTIERHRKLAEAAVAHGDDEAARSELRQKADHARLAETISQQVTMADALSRRLRNQVAAMRAKLAEARRKLVDISVRSRAAAAQRKFVDNLPDEACAGAVWSNFVAMCARVEQSEAEAEALLDLLGEPELTEPLDSEIEAELCALKEAASHVTC